MIDHLENGRVELTDERIKHMVKAYGYTMEDFYYLEEQKILRDETITQCQSILNVLDNEKLQAVQALLQNFR
ncbi:MAG: hypothetical protein A2404_07945 [Bdellovibrionales bacterium RIFOXYC1_FULL_39_130]|nr:MAG: hypothetical protein A2404_07945 [Bdellovibrionales bacterium RIFOXYC1_FULL_39_130]